MSKVFERSCGATTINSSEERFLPCKMVILSCTLLPQAKLVSFSHPELARMEEYPSRVGPDGNKSRSAHAGIGDKETQAQSHPRWMDQWMDSESCNVNACRSRSLLAAVHQKWTPSFVSWLLRGRNTYGRIPLAYYYSMYARNRSDFSCCQQIWCWIQLLSSFRPSDFQSDDNPLCRIRFPGGVKIFSL